MYWFYPFYTMYNDVASKYFCSMATTKTMRMTKNLCKFIWLDHAVFVWLVSVSFLLLNRIGNETVMSSVSWIYDKSMINRILLFWWKLIFYSSDSEFDIHTDDISLEIFSWHKMWRWFSNVGEIGKVLERYTVRQILLIVLFNPLSSTLDYGDYHMNIIVYKYYINVAYTKSEKIVQGFFPHQKKDNNSFSRTVSLIVSNNNTSSLFFFFVCYQRISVGS
jgi:hypothetical protein